MRHALLVSLCLIWATAAPAGPWLRETGTTFVSSGVTLNRLRDHSSTTYIEHGWSETLTLGADVSFATSHLGTQAGAVTLFFRRQLGTPTDTSRFAYELGAGTAWTQGAYLPHAKLGLSWGRGIELAQKPGWLTVDAALFHEFTTGEQAVKIDGTLGLNFTDKTSGMMQIYYTHLLGESTTTLAPSLILTPGKGTYRLQLGLETPLDAPDLTAIKLGIWREF